MTGSTSIIVSRYQRIARYSHMWTVEKSLETMEIGGVGTSITHRKA